jgi:periodic tryptophan protein 1
MSSMITTTAWVRRGVAAQFPTKYEIDEEEMNRISKLARMQLEEAQDDLSAAKAGKMDDVEEDAAMDEDSKEADAMEEEGEKKTAKDGNEMKSTEYVYRQWE